MIPNFNNPMAQLNRFVPNWNGNQEFQPTLLQSLTGYTDSSGIKSNGWGGMALGAASGLGSAYLGMKQYGMAKKQLSESKRQFDLNYGAQRQMVNTDLEDRQRARVASNPTAYESVGSYMDRNKVR
ncbi:hypothetical protein [Vreelandella venusta]|uniref:hypothetical protein n=1 Tax=Vreelandella venusta TaxID=44935 RepID=UPI0011696695|nr:hypothetical protein [Halomonas venusta]GEK52348.1 hypothetical protein HVE01_30690 [Halomonas venusta]